MHIGSMATHHCVESGLGAADDGAEALLADLSLEFGVGPAGVIVRHVDLRIGAVPGRKALVDVASNGTERAGDEVDHTGKFGFAILEW